MKISILTPDLSQNCLGRAYLLAKVLQRKYEVEIIGCLFGDTTWKPLTNMNGIPYKFVKITKIPKAYYQLIKLLKEIDTDVIYASKPLITSFGIGLLKKAITKKPLILDIDDWEWGFVYERYYKLARLQRYKELLYSAINFFKIGSYFNRLASEKMISFADEITVSNHFLQKRFGGIIVCHGKDTDVFDPAKFDRNAIREQYSIGKDKRIVMFLGTPRGYKGIEDLIEATSLLQDTNLILTIVGLDEGDGYCQDLKKFACEKLNTRFQGFGLIPFKNVPEFLTMADIVVIPQRRNSLTLGQVPAKIFDAMAMAKPIIGTSVSDLPEILDGCGWIVEPETPERLANVMKYILDHPEEGEQMGAKARQKCIEKYSWNAMESALTNIFSMYE